MSSEFVVERAAANLPQSTTETLFTISGGYVLLVYLIGEVTTEIGGSVTFTVDVGQQSPWTRSLTTSDVAGRIFGYEDDDLTAASAVAAVPVPRHPMAITDGSTIRAQTDASVSGQVKWTAFYRPLTPGAKVTAN
jgi:hypothetical protein